MKPREFDELIRQKFDQGDFAYNPRGWESMSEQLDGKAKKRSILMWWLMPLAGVAASVALAMVGIKPTFHENGHGNQTVKVQPSGHTNPIIVREPQAGDNSNAVASINPYAVKTGDARKPRNKKAGAPGGAEEDEQEVRISFRNAFPGSHSKSDKEDIDLLDNKEDALVKKTDKKKEVIMEPAGTFKPEVAKKPAGVSFTLAGGYNQGSVLSGYMAGVTIRKMVNNTVFVEGDVAFNSSNITQTINELKTNQITTVSYTGNAITFSNGGGNIINPPVPVSPVAPGPGPGPDHAGVYGQSARMAGVGAKTTNGGILPDGSGALKTTGGGNDNTNTIPDPGKHEVRTVENYNVPYAQITPSLGVKISKKISVAAGPDFQKALADNRPTVESRDNVQMAAMFDVGMVAKSEYSVTKNIKAGFYYRKGINGVLSPSKYLDRDYMQLQLKWSIFNK